MTERKDREKAYHNNAFKQGTRKSADKYYTIHKVSFDELTQKLELYGRDKNVLEYGCGPGSHSFILAAYAQKVVSVDISDYAIKKAQQLAEEKKLHNLSFVVMDAEDLEFDKETFDMIYGNAILHHLNLEKAFKEIERVLKTGGKAFFYEPLGHNFFINVYRRLTPRMRTVDEHPLLMKDINYFKKYFKKVHITYYHFTTLLAVPFRNLKIYDSILTIFHRTDVFLFRYIPFLRRYAWYCVIEIEKVPLRDC